MLAIALTIDEAARVSGLSRSKLYEILGRQEIDAKKAGKRTLIVADSLQRYIEALPAATIRPATRAVAA